MRTFTVIVPLFFSKILLDLGISLTALSILPDFDFSNEHIIGLRFIDTAFFLVFLSVRATLLLAC